MKYQVAAAVTISMHCIVEANSAEEAIERADAADMIQLCWQCGDSAHGRNGVSLDQWHTSGEFDGTPQEMTAKIFED